MDLTKPLVAVACLALVQYSVFLYPQLSGSLLLFLFAFDIAALAVAVCLISELILPKSRKFMRRMLTAFVAFALAFLASGILFEFMSSEVPNAGVLPTMPRELEMRRVNIPGSVDSFYWQNVLHVHNQSGFRSTAPYRKQEGVFRIMVLGDSLTYGYGVSADKIYASRLEKELTKITPTKVYNLGSEGYNTTDEYAAGRVWIPILQPHMVICGICLNDFLPPRLAPYANNMRYAVPLPGSVKHAICERTVLGSALCRGYNQLLIRWKLRQDFFDDVLSNVGTYQNRFRNDLEKLNQIAVRRTGHSVIAIVLNYSPEDARSRRLAALEEALAHEAGMEVVSMESFYKQYGSSNVDFTVSRWEQHPNEQAHSIFATTLLPAVKNHPVFVEYCKNNSGK